MNRPAARTRCLFGALLLAYALVCISFRVTFSYSTESLTHLALWALLLVVVRAFVLSRLPEVVRNARWLLLRPVIVWELTGLAACAAGMATGFGTTGPWRLAFAAALFGGCAAVVEAARDGEGHFPVVSRGFFLWARGHFDDWSARRHVLAHLVLGGLFGAALALMLRATPERGERMLHILVTAAGAVLVTAVQVNPQRGVSFLHFGLLALFAAALGQAIEPGAAWPPLLLGAAAGLALPGLSTALLMQVPPRQRFAAVALAEGGAVVAAFAAAAGVRELPAEPAAWSLAFLSLLAFGGFLRLYFREFAEIVQELVYWPMYRLRAYGPGLTEVPTRGPVLLIANHAAYFDPLFLAKFVPLRVRAMMISTMFDKPFLKWLAGDIYGSIRVPDRPGFRRHMPEIDQAIAALKNGENIMIFPEGWLRRKEEQPLHRFAQGVYRILKEVPDTPVLPCWIEGSWGSYLSYKNGPPTRNKKFDWWYRIRIGFGEPEVLPPEVLDDHKATRRHLMERVLHARTYLGLPAYPMPGLTSIDPEEYKQLGNGELRVEGRE